MKLEMAMDVGGILLVDRLSGLSDALLVSILSLLQLDEVARCTILTSCWRRLFSSDLLIDFCRYPENRVPPHTSPKSRRKTR
jgi:hypothetical protein